MNFCLDGLCLHLHEQTHFYLSKNASVSNLRTSRRDKRNQNWRRRKWSLTDVRWCSLRHCRMYAVDTIKRLPVSIKPIEFLSHYQSLITNKLDMNIDLEALPSSRHRLQLDTAIFARRKRHCWSCRKKSFSSMQPNIFIKHDQF